MAMVLRKKPTSVIRTTASKPKNPTNWLIFFKPALMLVGLFFAYVVYSQWSNWLAMLDKTPIRAYALTHKTQFTTNADIREWLSQEPKLKGYFAQDIQAIKDRFLAQPWIQDVAVRKVYPDRISLTLVEHRPVAVWNQDELLSDKGVNFSLPADRFERKGLPELYGPVGEGKTVLAAWYKIQQDLASRNLGLKSVAMDSRGSWTISLNNHVELRLGRGDWLPKIDRFVTIFPEIDIPEGKRLSYVDLRYEHGAAVGFVPK